MRYWLPMVTGLVAAWAGIAIADSERGRELEFEIEQKLQVMLAPVKLSDRIKIIEISPEDTAKLTHSRLDTLPRHYHAELIDGLKRAGARVLVLDLLFTTDQPKSEDERFTNALLTSDPLKVALVQDPNNDPDPKARNGFTYEFEPPDFLPEKLPDNVSLGQAEPVYTGPLSGDLALVCHDEKTGAEVPNVALLAYCLYYGVSGSDIEARFGRHELVAGPSSFQMDTNGGMIVDWPTRGAEYSSIPYSEALSTLKRGDPDHSFKDRIVFVGNGNDDRVLETVIGQVQGTWVLAYGTDTMLRTGQGATRRILTLINIVWPLLISGWITLSLASVKRIYKFVAIAAGLCSAIGVPALLLWTERLCLDVTRPAAAAVLAIAAGSIMLTIAPAMFPMARKMTFEATILIADLKESTPTVHRHGPRVGGRALNLALDQARRCIESAGGSVVRTQGDAIVGIFPAGSLPEHAVAAVRTALKVASLRGLGTGSGDVAGFRCGVESGTVYGGERDTQGLPFHVAARLQVLCAELACDVLVGPTAHALSGHSVEMREAGDFTLKGIAGTVSLWKPSSD